jgi:hypothetical protein
MITSNVEQEIMLLDSYMGIGYDLPYTIIFGENGGVLLIVSWINNEYKLYIINQYMH